MAGAVGEGLPQPGGVQRGAAGGVHLGQGHAIGHQSQPGLLGVQDGGQQVGFPAGARPSDPEGAGHVGPVAVDYRPEVAHHQVSVSQWSGAGSGVGQGAVGAGGHDCLECTVRCPAGPHGVVEGQGQVGLCGSGNQGRLHFG